MLGQAERLIELRDLFRKEDENDTPSGIIAFASGKGGTGKTFLSLNISYEISAMNKKVLYVDLDFNLANAHLLLDINPSATLSDFFMRRKPLADVIYKQTENFHALFGESGRTGSPEVSCVEINFLISEIRKLDYEAVVLDLPAGAGRNVLDTLALSDLSVIVTTPEPTAVMDAYALTKLIKFDNLKCRQAVIINKCRSKDEGLFAFTSLNSASGHFLNNSLELLHFVGNSTEAYESVIRQKLAVAHYNSSRVTTEIRHIAHKITEILQLDNIDHPY